LTPRRPPAVLLRLRQHADAGGVRRAVRALDDPLSGEAAVRGGNGQLLTALPREGQHGKQGARAAPAHIGHGGPHGARRGHPLHPAAVPGFRCGHRAQAVRGTRSLPDRRQGVEGRGERGPRLAEDQRGLGPCQTGADLRPGGQHSCVRCCSRRSVHAPVGLVRRSVPQPPRPVGRTDPLLDPRCRLR